MDVSFPIQLDHAFLRQLLLQQFYTGPDQTSVVWRDENGCTEMVLSKPVIGSAPSGLTLGNDFRARLGAGIGKLCLGVSPWNGIVELVLQPKVNESLAVVDFRVVDSHVYGPDGRKQFTGTIWDYVKNQIHPHFESFVVDLRRPIAELKLVLPFFLPREDADRTQRLLESIRLSQVSVTDTGLSAIVHLDVEPGAVPPVPMPEPTLTIEEVQRWEAAWQSWDAFLTFIIKRAGRETVDPGVIRELQDVLIEARYDLLPALRPTAPNQVDPVRPLFIRTWQRLAPVLRQLSTGIPGESAIRYLSFVAAADALAALDQLGPEFGFDISSDGLRRLARTVDPASIEDPTRYTQEVDPELRRMFGFGKPLPVPEIPAPSEGALEEAPLEAADEILPGPASTPAPSADTASTAGMATPTPAAPTAAAPTTATPPAELSPAVPLPTATLPLPTPTVEEEYLDPAPVPPRSSWLPRWDRWFVSPAFAAEPVDTKRLYRWVPDRSEVNDYLRIVREVLIAARKRTQADGAVPAEFLDVYANLIFATAWQETCWRQFIKSGGSIRTIASPVGAVGIMQVNSKVWRGFYNVEALRADLAYNANAGSEIVRHYFIDYAIKKGEHKVGGDLHAAARATYSAYNAGPGGLSRYRKPAGQKKGSIDAKFWEKYQQVRAGRELAVSTCFGVDPPA